MHLEFLFYSFGSCAVVFGLVGGLIVRFGNFLLFFGWVFNDYSKDRFHEFY